MVTMFIERMVKSGMIRYPEFSKKEIENMVNDALSDLSLAIRHVKVAQRKYHFLGFLGSRHNNKISGYFIVPMQSQDKEMTNRKSSRHYRFLKFVTQEPATPTKALLVLS